MRYLLESGIEYAIKPKLYHHGYQSVLLCGYGNAFGECVLSISYRDAQYFFSEWGWGKRLFLCDIRRSGGPGKSVSDF